MPTENKPLIHKHNGWVFKVFPSTRPQPEQLFILLHGWTGDEHSMDIFVRSLPNAALAISPRAPFSLPENGYSWNPLAPDHAEAPAKLQAVAAQLWQEIRLWKEYLDLQPALPLHLIGFSQGAAMAYLLTIDSPGQILKTACLSGYLPEGAVSRLKPHLLAEHAFFIAHGTEDRIIPVERARDACNHLQAAGARVTYCESPVGHKLAAECFSALKDFFSAEA